MLETRFQKSRTIPGTRSLHTFIPATNATVATKRYSFSNTFKIEKVTKEETELEMELVCGFVTCSHNSCWWLGCVLEKYLDDAEVKFTLLHPHGPSLSFKYPSQPDIVTLPLSSILTIVEPRTTTGRQYSIRKTESKAATTKLKAIV